MGIPGSLTFIRGGRQLNVHFGFSRKKWIDVPDKMALKKEGGASGVERRPEKDRRLYLKRRGLPPGGSSTELKTQLQKETEKSKRLQLCRCIWVKLSAATV